MSSALAFEQEMIVERPGVPLYPVTGSAPRPEAKIFANLGKVLALNAGVVVILSVLSIWVLDRTRLIPQNGTTRAIRELSVAVGRLQTAALRDPVTPPVARSAGVVRSRALRSARRNGPRGDPVLAGLLADPPWIGPNGRSATPVRQLCRGGRSRPEFEGYSERGAENRVFGQD